MTETIGQWCTGVGKLHCAHECKLFLPKLFEDGVFQIGSYSFIVTLSLIMQNIKAVLNAASLEVDDIVKATIFVTDLGQMAEFNKHYPTYFTAPFPAREAIGVKELPLGATIEVSVIASR